MIIGMYASITHVRIRLRYMLDVSIEINNRELVRAPCTCTPHVHNHVHAYYIGGWVCVHVCV